MKVHSDLSLSICFLRSHVRVQSHLPAYLCPLHDLKSDFESLISDPEKKPRPDAEIHLRGLTEFPKLTELPFKMSWRGKTIGWAQKPNSPWLRKIECSDSAKVLVNFHSSPAQIEIYTSQTDWAYQLAYQYTLAMIGERLEVQGYVRLHGAAWRANGGGGPHAHLLLADSGAGKSTLAKHLESQNPGSVLADELVFYKDDLLFPLPLPIAFQSEKPMSLRIRSWQNSKKLLNLRPLSQEAYVLENLFVLQTSGVRGLVAKLELIAKTVLGIGLPQMGELYLRWANLRQLFKTAEQRRKAAAALLKKSVFYFQYDPNDKMRVPKLLEGFAAQGAVKMPAILSNASDDLTAVANTLPRAGSQAPRTPSTLAPP